MFGAELRYLDAAVAAVNHFLLHTFHLIAQHHGIAAAALQHYVLQHGAALGLLHRQDCEAFFVQVINSFHRVINIFPIDCELSPQRCLVHLGMRRNSRNAAQINALYAESVRRAKHRTDVVQGTHVVQHHGQGQLLRRLKLFRTDAVQLCYLKLTHILQHYGRKDTPFCSHLC